jgi:cytochrome P450
MALDAAGTGARAVGVRPAIKPLGLWQAYRTARRNVLELIPEAAYREPVLTGGKNPGWIMVTEPEALERVFKTRAQAYIKSGVMKRLMRPRRGENLAIADHATARWQRRAMAAAFTPGAAEACTPLIRDAAEAAVRRIAKVAPGRLDLYPEMVTTTCDVICDIALSGRQAVDRMLLADSVNAYIRDVARVSILDLLGAPYWVPRPGEIVHGARGRMDRLIDGIIAQRRSRGPSDPPDFLDRLLAAQDPETGQRLDALSLRNNLAGFLFAGHETSALSLTWALYLCASSSAVQEKAAAEAQAALAEGAGSTTLATRLPYTRQVIEEALRLFPPAGFLTRTATEEDELAGQPVRPGMTAILPIYALHRHALLWDHPETIDPDRFSPENAAKRHRFAFLPFGGGPRICIGASLAMVETQIILATVLSRFRVSLPASFQPEPKMWFTLRPATGMPLEVVPRG